MGMSAVFVRGGSGEDQASVNRRRLRDALLLLILILLLACIVWGALTSTAMAADSRIEPAIAWGKARLGWHDWDEYCLTFCWAAYNYGAGASMTPGFQSAKEVANATGAASRANTEPPRGAWVFYDWVYNGENLGHVGMSLGDGTIIEARNGVRITARGSVGLAYIGWSAPPMSPPMTDFGSVSPAKPSDITTAGVSTSEIRVNWRDNSSNELGFIVSMSDGGGTWWECGRVPANVTTYTEGGFQPDTGLFFAVAAYNDAGVSWSDVGVWGQTLALPTITALNPTSGSTAGGTSVIIAGTNLSGATAVSFGGTAATGFTVNSATQITATAPAHAAGSVRVQVTTPGGTTADTAADNYTYVTPLPPPAITSLSATRGTTLGGLQVDITGTNLSGATAVSFGGTAAQLYVIVSSTQIQAITPSHAAGTVDVRVTTPYGTSANTSADDYTYAVIGAPTITGLDPIACPVSGGPVTIYGTNLAEVTSVYIDRQPVSIVAHTETTITVTAPAHAAGVVPVSVFTLGGWIMVDYTYVAPPSPPTITSLSPSSGTTAGGTSVIVTGSNLGGATAVTFGGVSATSFTVNSATRITAVTPAHSSGTVRVQVTTPDGTSPDTPADDYTYAVVDPTLIITSPAGAGTYSSGNPLTVNWTSDRSLSTGEFGVWVRSASQQWYIGQLVPASGGASFSKTITLSLPAGSGYQVIVAYRPTSGGNWGSWSTGSGSFSMTAGLPYLTITSPTGPGTYTSGSPLTVNWTSDQSLSTGEFGVWVRSATQNWYIGQLVPASGGTSFSKAITLSLPAGTGYQVIVAYRATSGSSWGCWATSWWSFTTTAGLPYLTITSPTGPGTYTSGSPLTVNWTSDQSLSTGEFGVWVRSAGGSWYIGQAVPATGGTTFSKPITLTGLPAASGYQVIVGYRPTAGSGTWGSFATSWGSFAVTAP